MTDYPVLVQDYRNAQAEIARLREIIRKEIDAHHADYRGYCFGCKVYRNPMELCHVAVRLRDSL